MAIADRRLRERAREALHHSTAGRTVLLATVAFVVVLHTIANILATLFLMVDQIHLYRAWLLVAMGLGVVINLVLVILVWMIFETLGRVGREADRLQTFMDHTYRRLP